MNQDPSNSTSAKEERREALINIEATKSEFSKNIEGFISGLNSYVETKDGQWTIKGFIDVYRNIYTISSDTKIVSKILEIHLFPKLLEFAEKFDYHLVLADNQNYYPDITFIKNQDERIKIALDIKTTYRLKENPIYCNGFTLGSHGEYFKNRESKKNIQFPYKEYCAHYCLGVIYSRALETSIGETQAKNISKLESITSVIKDLEFFIAEKWQIASDTQGSSNTANIGSIVDIEGLKSGNGVFSKLGESWFDDYWMNYGQITVRCENGKTKKITNLRDFVIYRKGDVSLIVKKNGKKKAKQT